VPELALTTTVKEDIGASEEKKTGPGEVTVLRATSFEVLEKIMIA
jgi:hypothetical protein